MKYELCLPFPPSTNQYWRHIVIKGQPRTLISNRGREYHNQVIQTCCAANLAGIHLTTRLIVYIQLNVPDKRKRDMDNYNKALLDALSAARVWHDDEQIDILTIRRGPQVKGGEAVVTIMEFDGEYPIPPQR